MKNTLKILAFTISLTMALFPAVGLAAGQSVAPAAQHITVTNNSGVADTIKVVNLLAGDIVKVYSDDSVTVLGQKTAVSKSTIVKVELEPGDGTIYVSVTSKGKTESDLTPKDYDEEPQSTAPDAADITVANNSGKQDTVKVFGLSSGDIVKVYDNGSPANLLGQAKVASGATSTTIKIAQLGVGAGTINVSVTSKGKRESVATAKAYSAEATSSSPDVGDMTVVNNAGSPDVVTVAGLSSGAVVKVYPDNLSNDLLGKATVASGATSVTIRISQLGAMAGSVFIAVTSPGAAESGRIEKAYDAEAASAPPIADDITVVNKAGDSDTVTVAGAESDLVKVYSDVGLNDRLGQAAIAKGSTSAIISIPQLGTAAGSVFVTISSTGKAESNPTEKTYDAELKSTQPDANDITVVNNAGVSDTATVAGTEGDVIKVYSDVGLTSLLGQTKVAKGATTAIVSITQLGISAGSVYITISSTGKAESDPTAKNYDAEPQSIAPDVDDISVVNNAGISDTITVTGVEGDLMKVYSDAGLSTLLGQATVAKGAISATVSIRQLPASGAVYITLTSTGKCESNGTLKTFGDEIDSPPPTADDVTVTNNAGIPDTVKVDYLDAGDIIKVYATATATKVWGQATVGKDASSITINFKQLGGAGGTIYVSLCKSGMMESDRTEKVFAAEAKSAALDAASINVANNAGLASKVTVDNLEPGDVVAVYEDAKLATLLGQATVAKGFTTAQVSVQDLSSTGGSVYVTVARTGLLESDATEKSFAAQAESEPLDLDNVLIINNTGTDLVIVYGLNPGDIVKIYQDESSTKALGTATVAVKQSQVIITLSQLGESGGSVFLTYTSVGNLESDRIGKSFSAE